MKADYYSYTMNLAQATRMVLDELGMLPDIESPLEKPLPWRQSLGLRRRDENVRPIFWRNRNRSYVARTQDWDEFPNGRWRRRSNESPVLRLVRTDRSDRSNPQRELRAMARSTRARTVVASGSHHNGSRRNQR